MWDYIIYRNRLTKQIPIHSGFKLYPILFESDLVSESLPFETCVA